MRGFLTEVGVEVGGVAHVAASTRVSTVVGALVGALLAAVLAVLELVLEPARGGAGVLADEDAGLHVRHAVGSDDGHVAADHVDLAGNVDDAVGAEGVLAPGLGNLTVDKVGVVVHDGPSTAGAIGEGEGLVLAGGNADGDKGSLGVDPRAGGAPDNEDDVLVGLVVVGVGPLAIRADPDLGAGAADGVLASGDETLGDNLCLVGDGEKNASEGALLHGSKLTAKKLVFAPLPNPSNASHS